MGDMIEIERKRLVNAIKDRRLGLVAVMTEMAKLRQPLNCKLCIKNKHRCGECEATKFSGQKSSAVQCSNLCSRWCEKVRDIEDEAMELRRELGLWIAEVVKDDRWRWSK